MVPPAKSGTDIPSSKYSYGYQYRELEIADKTKWHYTVYFVLLKPYFVYQYNQAYIPMPINIPPQHF